MSWKTRICGEELYHHIYAWGNDRHPVFKDHYHYINYLQLLQQYSIESRIDIIAYALMQWHVHLFVYDRDNTISTFMHHLHGDYAQFYNRETHRVGHVFGERFHNKIVLVNEHGTWLSRYINRQAVAAKIVSDPKDYPWTSYRIYIGLDKNHEFLKHDVIIRQYGEGKEAFDNYTKFVLGADNGPINWDDKKIAIGPIDKIIQRAVNEYGISSRVLLSPSGMTEHRARQNVIYSLYNEHGYKIREIARSFKMSHTAVAKIIKKLDIE